MIDKLRSGYLEHFARTPWQWFISLSLKDSHYERHLRQIRQTFREKLSGQVGYSGIFVGGGGHTPHVHSLWVGQFPGSKTLLDIDPEYWHNTIGDIIKNHSGVDIAPVYSVGAISYMFLPRNLPSDDLEWFSWGRLVTRRL